VLLSFFADVTGTITPNTPITATTSFPGQNVLYSFSGTAGQQASVSLTNSTYTAFCWMTVSILNPDGSTLSSANMCANNYGSLGPVTLGSTGTFTLKLDPSGPGTGSVTVLLSLQ